MYMLLDRALSWGAYKLDRPKGDNGGKGGKHKDKQWKNMQWSQVYAIKLQ